MGGGCEGRGGSEGVPCMRGGPVPCAVCPIPCALRLVLSLLWQARPQGSRPVTLVGYSLGARVIFECCLALAKAGPDALGILQDGGWCGLCAGVLIAGTARRLRGFAWFTL
jgi:hypothetical protein